MITPIDNRGISRARRRKRKRKRDRSVGGRTADNAVPPDTHPSRAVCCVSISRDKLVLATEPTSSRESCRATYPALSSLRPPVLSR
ncbi:hypothetical protein PUN28_014969 [Cardiocondyla obscurior]|uniref:Uncharacterized protein n=1 Tax=Cardiocondyla obscurior TaxID=286306 RepID=A0AAW2F1E3_9HYME